MSGDELKRRITNTELWNMEKECLWSLIRCSRTSSGIIGEHLELFTWQMEVSKCIEIKVNCGQCVFYKNIYFIMIFPPMSNSYPMKGLIFVNFFNKRSKGLTMQIHFHSLLCSYLPPYIKAFNRIRKLCWDKKTLFHFQYTHLDWQNKRLSARPLILLVNL